MEGGEYASFLAGRDDLLFVRKVKTQMPFDEHPRGEERVDQEEVWSAIRYLDPDKKGPDKKDKDRTSNVGTVIIVAAFALLITVCAVWALLLLQVFAAAQ